MAYGLYISAEGAAAQNRRLETIANNLANVDTAGFKRDLAIFQCRYAEETAQGIDFPGSGTRNDIGGGVQQIATLTDFSEGPLKTTGGITDLAIAGEGFFVVRRGNQDFLTRDGSFSRNSEGILVNPMGDAVLSDDGSPVLIDDSAGPWQWTEDGAVQQAGAKTYLALAQPRSLGDLVKVGENLFKPLAETAPLDPGSRRVLSGQIEQSGVRATEEMMEMLQASRAFEANVNMIRNQDQMLGNLIGRLLKA